MNDLTNWTPRPMPESPSMEGRFVHAELFDAARDGAALFAAIGGEENNSLWTHIPVGPFATAEELTDFFAFAHDQLAWRTYLFCAPGGVALGTASYMRIRPEHGSVEVGSVIFSPALKRTPAATEAMYLMARTVFRDLGYRRYEWKCNAANEVSKRAATRLGFIFEGTFRQDMVVKGKNRDTHWFSMLDNEWPKIEQAFEAWLDPSNFEDAGGQKRSLASFRS